MGLSLLYTSFLAVGLLTPLLIFAYRNQEKRTLKPVSSLVILRKLPKRTLSLKRFKPPFRFFVELLALLLILLGAAGLSLKLSSARKLLLVDNSLSMSAVTVNSTGPHALIDEAKQKISEAIRGNQSEYDLFITSPILTRIGGLGGGDLNEHLKKIAISPTADDIDSRLLEAVTKYGFKEGLIVSDKRAERPSAKFQAIKVGRVTENIFIAGYQWLNDQQLRVKIGHSGPTNTLAKVQVLSLTPTNQFNSSSNLYINGDTTKEVDFKVSFKAGDRIKLSVESASGSFTEDSIRDDNQLELDYRLGSSKRVLVVSDEPDLQTRSKLSKIPGWSFTFNNLTEFAALSPEQRESFTVQIFYKVVPSAPLKGSALFVLPPADNTVFPVRDELVNQQVTSWQDNHPLNSYLRLPLFSFPAVKVFREGAGMLAVINIGAGPIVVVRDQGDTRAAAVGFEILPYEGRDDPLLSVFTLNLLNWFGSERLQQQPSTSESYSFQELTFNPAEADSQSDSAVENLTEPQPLMHWLAYAAIILLSIEAVITAVRRWS